MKAFFVTIDNKHSERAYTSLKDCCSNNGLNYTSASRGKRLWLKGETVIRINTITVQKHKKKVRTTDRPDRMN